MATDWRAKAKALGENWKTVAQNLGYNPNNINESQYRAIKKEIDAQATPKNTGNVNKPGVSKTKDATVLQLPDITSIFSGILDVMGNAQAEKFNADKAQSDQILQNLVNLGNEKIAGFNLQGVQAQADATKFASEQSANATKFASSEAARAQITSTELATSSAERQIGLQGTENRLLAVTQGEQERMNIAATGVEQRLNIGETGRQERMNISATGTEQRLTQAQLLAGQERQIGLTGQQQRLTQGQLLAGQERQIQLTGREQRSTQQQLLAGQERQIMMTGAEQRSTIQEQARQDRNTALQSELFRRYKEQKDQSDALRSFRA